MNNRSRNILNKQLFNTKSIKEIVNNISDAKCQIIAKWIVLSMLGSLLVQEIAQGISGSDTLDFVSMGFYVIGPVSIIFSAFYIVKACLRSSSVLLAIKNHLVHNIWDGFLIVLLIWSFISSVLSDDRTTAFYGSGYRKDGFFAYVTYAGMYVCAKIVFSEQIRKKIAQMYMITVTCLSGMSLLQFIFMQYHIKGHFVNHICSSSIYMAVFSNTNHFAYFMTMGIMIIAGILLFEDKMIYKILYSILFVFNTWSLIINDTFGAYLAIGSGTVFLAVIIIFYNKKRFLTALYIIVLFIGTSYMVNYETNIISRNLDSLRGDVNKIENKENVDTIGSSRGGLLKQGVKFVMKKPLFGYGPEGVIDEYDKRGYDNDRPHNEYLQYAIFMGIPGGIFYLSALISLFVARLKRLKKLTPYLIIVGGGVFGYCISALFGNTMYYTTPFYFILLGVLSQSKTEKYTEEKE